jgi:hypothetical protein
MFAHLDWQIISFSQQGKEPEHKVLGSEPIAIAID